MKRNCSKRIISLMVALLLALGVCGTAFAEGWTPEKPITVIIPFGAGDGLDLTSRALFENVDLPTVLENVTGGSGTIGVQEAYSRPADGYTITLLSVASALSQPLLNDTLTYTLESWRPLQILCSPIIATLACNSKGSQDA